MFILQRNYNALCAHVHEGCDSQFVSLCVLSSCTLVPAEDAITSQVSAALQRFSTVGIH